MNDILEMYLAWKIMKVSLEDDRCVVMSGKASFIQAGSRSHHKDFTTEEQEKLRIEASNELVKICISTPFEVAIYMADHWCSKLENEIKKFYTDEYIFKAVSIMANTIYTRVKNGTNVKSDFSEEYEIASKYYEDTIENNVHLNYLKAMKVEPFIFVLFAWEVTRSIRNSSEIVYSHNRCIDTMIKYFKKPDHSPELDINSNALNKCAANKELEDGYKKYTEKLYSLHQVSSKEKLQASISAITKNIILMESVIKFKEEDSMAEDMINMAIISEMKESFCTSVKELPSLMKPSTENSNSINCLIKAGIYEKVFSEYQELVEEPNKTAYIINLLSGKNTIEVVDNLMDNGKTGDAEELKLYDNFIKDFERKNKYCKNILLDDPMEHIKASEDDKKKIYELVRRLSVNICILSGRVPNSMGKRLYSDVTESGLEEERKDFYKNKNLLERLRISSDTIDCIKF